MIVIDRIVVPTDFSQGSAHALRQAVEFARRFNAEIVLVHVIEPPVYPAMTFGAAAASLPAIHAEIRDNATKHLERLCAELTQQGIKARFILRDGSPFLEIVGVAEQEKANLIVIATHGHSGIKHLLLGSTAEKVVRKARCPVLTVREPSQETHS
jgi:nucleotide-binding universal stress UspA family protein